ncbi:MAG: metallophosphoesterase [Bacteroidota bacterium]
MGKRFVLGDIHGAGKALTDCLEFSGFDNNNDQLICLGDVCDGWPDVRSSIDQLLNIKNLIYIMGNHDEWACQWMKDNEINDVWLPQGGYATMKSYQKGIPQEHIDFLARAHDYFVMENKLFVHGGILPDIPLSEQGRSVFLWDRSLLEKAMNRKDGQITEFDEVYLGHTPTLKMNSTKPLKFSEIRMIDTGAGWNGGKLTIMDIDSKEYWQSQPVQTYYPGVKGRG